MLDAAYADQRPLYAVEADMTSIKQSDKNLQQYHNAINYALNSVISKIVSSYKLEDEQRSLIMEAQKKAIRTFIVGLKSRMMRQQPRTSSEAYTITQTILYDNEQLQLEQYPSSPRIQPRMYQQQKPSYKNYDKPQPQWNSTRNFTKPEPMEVDYSNRMRQMNWRQTNQQGQGQKREYNSSRQHFGQPQKMQIKLTNL